MPSVEPKHERAYAMCRRTKTTQYAPVAQMDRAIASDAMCRWFDSSRVYHKNPSGTYKSVTWVFLFALFQIKCNGGLCRNNRSS